MAASSSTGATEDIIIIINTQLLLLLLFFFLLLLRCGVSFGKKNKTPTFFTKPFFNQNQVQFLLLLLNRKSEKLSFVANPTETAIPATTPSLSCVCLSLSARERVRCDGCNECRDDSGERRRASYGREREEGPKQASD
jgi:hypothetical protein